MPGWVIGLLISIAIDALAYVIMPKPKSSPQGVQDLQAPTSEAGRTAMVIFGSMKVTSPNILDYRDANTNTYTVSTGGGGK